LLLELQNQILMRFFLFTFRFENLITLNKLINMAEVLSNSEIGNKKIRVYVCDSHGVVLGNAPKMYLSQIMPAVRDQLLKFGFHALTATQVHTWGIINRGIDLLSICTTGNSGDIISIFVPLIHRVFGGQRSRPVTLTTGPRALIMTGTREDVTRIENNLAEVGLLDLMGVKVASLYGNATTREEVIEKREEVIKRLRGLNKPNIVIGTPPRVSHLLYKGVLDLSQVHFVAILGMHLMPKSDVYFTINKKIIPALTRKDRQVVVTTDAWTVEAQVIANNFMHDHAVMTVRKEDE
jgi:superfamily II DNA/RNA helicase